MQLPAVAKQAFIFFREHSKKTTKEVEDCLKTGRFRKDLLELIHKMHREHPSYEKDTSESEQAWHLHDMLTYIAAGTYFQKMDMSDTQLTVIRMVLYERFIVGNNRKLSAICPELEDVNEKARDWFSSAIELDYEDILNAEIKIEL